MRTATANIIITIGLGLVLIGVLARLGLLAWFGKLPGDIRVEGERSSFYAPITSMIILSVIGSVLLSLIARIFRGE